MELRRLSAATLALSALVFGGSILVGQGRAQAGSQPTYVCSAADKQFIATVSSNMTQLGYWSDSLSTGDATPALVIKQSKAEAAQVYATRPTDPSLFTARSLLRKMFLEYGAAVKTKALGGSPGDHVRNAYTLANGVHELLLQAQPGMTAQGCNLAPLLQA
jgi:hypothetical protein